MPSAHDSRLLLSVLKTEKDAQASFKAWTKDSTSASSALSAWSVADSRDTLDIMDVANRITSLLSTCTQSQNSYLAALVSYRSSLKSLLAREASLRTILRDREILVGRLIKLNSKSSTNEAKLEDAQRELAACEAYLQEEELDLLRVKRRTFREALALRMKAMGELGRVLSESAGEAMELLAGIGGDDEFYVEHHDYGNGHERDDSLTPSNSASQARDDESDDESLEPPVPRIERNHSPSPTPQPNGHARSLSPPPRALSPPARPAPPRAVPRPILTVPSAPRPISSIPAPSDTPRLPSFEIPKAPPHVMAAAPADSSDDESVYPPEQPPTRPPRLRRRALSDSSSLHGTSARRTSFFGGIAALFKRRSPSAAAEEQRASWEPTRTDRTVERGSRVRGSSNLRDDDTSDDEGMPKHVVRVVNDPRKRAKALSDVGKSAPAPAPVLGGKLERKSKPASRKALSDVGVLSSILPEQPAPARRRRPSTVVAPPPPTTVAARQPLSRSSTVRTTTTVASARTTTTTNDTVKKRKKKVPAAIAPTPLPTAADLSASLPSATRSSFYDAPSLPTTFVAPSSPILLQPKEKEKEPRHRAPKSLSTNAARAKRESALLGSADWIAHPPAAHHAPARQVAENDLSLDAQVSRSYSAVGRTLGADLHKRKSVRLADLPDDQPERTASPPSSVRSDSREPPAKGILVNHTPSPSAALANGNVDTAWSRRREGESDESSEEDSEYAAAKKRLVRETRKLEGAYSGKDKGKGRAVPQS